MNTVKILITALCCVLFLSACVAATQEGDKGEQEDSTTGVKTEEI